MMGGGIRLALIGGAAGLVTALAAARGISSMLYGVGPADALALVTGAAVVSGAALAATWIPARRAARLEAVAALREGDE